MRFTEIDVFGVYVAPMSLMMVAAYGNWKLAELCSCLTKLKSLPLAGQFRYMAMVFRFIAA